MNVHVDTATIKLPPLPYSEDALEPVISARTLGFHYGKHHKAYVEKLNGLIEGTDYAKMTLEEIVRRSHRSKDDKEIFNNAAQAWNHTFFWSSLSPRVETPSSRLAKAIERDLGGFELMKKDLAEAGVKQFGSGWVWLVSDGGVLKIEKSHDAETPMAEGKTCLLTVDVWEHAYYLDYQNERPDYLRAVIDKLLNWEFASANYAAD
jgi:Fe-Mn family superoxide dismutase